MNIQMVLLACLATALMLAGSAGAADFPAGLGLDADAEKKLAAALEELAKEAKADQPDYAAMVRKLGSARGQAETLAAKAAPSGVATSQPAQFTAPDRSPVVLLGQGEAAVRGLWREQLTMNLAAAAGMLAGKEESVREWLPYSDWKKPAARVRPIADAVREAERAAGLLSRPGDIVAARKGELLFADDFSKGAGQWKAFGDFQAKNEPGAFRFVDTSPQHPDAMMWTEKEFDGNFVVEFAFIPHSEGARPGALFTICGRPRPGKDWAVCVGEDMDTYNYGIDGYHFSMHRGNTGLGNARRVGPGLKMLASGPDPCPKIGQQYQVQIGKFGPAIFLAVDGKLIHNYVDGATYGPVLAAGRIGLRHWAGMDASYKDFRVYRLAADAATSRPAGK